MNDSNIQRVPTNLPGQSCRKAFFGLILSLGLVLLPAPRGHGEGLPGWFEKAWFDHASQSVMLNAGKQMRDSDCPSVLSALQHLRFPERPGSDFRLAYLRGRDGKSRPYFVATPPDYDCRKPTPAIVFMHGGIDWKDLAAPVDFAREARACPLLRPTLERGWLFIYPFGQEGASWWDNVGMDTIRAVLRETKRDYCVDDDKVWVGGFSDGGSGALIQAMLRPSDFAAVFSLNGHFGAGNLEGQLPTFFASLAGTPLYVVNTTEDEIFAIWKMRALAKAAREAAGGDFIFRELPGGHGPGYLASEAPRLFEFLEAHPRNPFPPQIQFQSANTEFGSRSWVSIDRLKNEPPAPWHVEINPVLIRDRINLHFITDEDFHGPGVRVRRVFPQSVAEDFGLVKGDILTSIGSSAICDFRDFASAGKDLPCDSDLEVGILRNGKALKLKGRLPQPEFTYIFSYAGPSGMIRARAKGNEVTVETSRVGVFRLQIPPALFDLRLPLKVTVNGRLRFEGIIRPDPVFMFRRLLETRDRKAVCVAELRFDLTSNGIGEQIESLPR